jgi:hypothetical protein
MTLRASSTAEVIVAELSPLNYDQNRVLKPEPQRSNPLSQLRNSYQPQRYSRLSIWNSLNDSNLDLSILSCEDLKQDSLPIAITELRLPNVVFDYCHSVKTWSVLGLACAFLLSFVLIGMGGALVHNPSPPPAAWLRGTIARVGLKTKSYYNPASSYIPGHFSVPVSALVQRLIPLLLNYVLTAVLEALFTIHSTSQRWSLWREHRLEFHSNPSLFAASKSYFPNRWYTNVLFITATTFSYGTLATLTSTIWVWGYDNGDDGLSKVAYTGPHNGLDFSGWSMVVMGVCLAVQVAISACSVFYNPDLVKSWSQSALTTARASIYHQHERPLPETPIARHESFFVKLLHPKRVRVDPDLGVPQPSNCQTQDIPPGNELNYVKRKEQQPSPRDMIPSIRRITITLWLFTAALSIATTIVAIIAKRRGFETAAYVAEWSVDGGVPRYWSWFGALYFQYSDFKSYLIGESQNTDGSTIVMQSLFRAPLTLVLHYAGLLFDVVRDELLWRRASTRKGAKVNPGTIVSYFQNWPGLVLFLFKGLSQWIYGSVIQIDSIILVALIPMATLALLMLLLSTFAEVLSRWRPKGEQPATFGSLRLLEKYMDDLESDTVFWRSRPNEPLTMHF